MRLSGWFLLRQMAKKLDKGIEEVTAEDIHKFGHLPNTLIKAKGNKKYPRLFEEQVSLEVAQEIIDTPDKVWESR